MILDAILILATGLILLLLGSSFLVNSTESFSSKYSISGFVASFFLIGVSTSAPEIFISIESALKNETILAIGNAVGSNISNIALVFAVSIFFMNTENKFMDHPARAIIGMWFLTLSAILIIIIDSFFSIFDAMILIILFFVMLFFMKYSTELAEETNQNKSNKSSAFSILLYSVTGLVMLTFGSNFFISGATEIAILFGVSTYVIGLTLTALGTSLPELSASIQSARKGREDFIVGNIIGSNIFNIAIAMSIAGLIQPTMVIENEFIRDTCMLIFSMVIFYFIIKSHKNTIKIVYSALLVISYVVYLSYILN